MMSNALNIKFGPMVNFMMYFMAKIFVHYLENISKTSQMVQMVLHLVILEKKVLRNSTKEKNTQKHGVSL